MKNSLKSALAVFFVPALLVVCFKSNVIKSQTVSRGPAVEQKTKVITVKSAVKEYLLAVNNIK